MGWLESTSAHNEVGMQMACSKEIDSTFDILNDRSIYPTVVQLQAGDGGMQHAITVVGQLIFDSNCVRALYVQIRNNKAMAKKGRDWNNIIRD